MDFQNKDEVVRSLQASLRVTGLDNQPQIFNSSDYIEDRQAARGGATPRDQNLDTRGQPVVVLSNDPATSAVAPAWVTFETLRQMKDFGGVPDALYQGADGIEPRHPLPAPFNADKMKNAEPAHEDLCRAFQASIYSDSSQVRAYEDVLNEKRFPVNVATYNFDDLVVASGTRLEIKDETSHGQPIIVICNTLTIENGGRLVVTTNCTIVAGEVLAMGSSAQHPVIIAQADAGADGQPGRAGTDHSDKTGSSGNDGRDNKNSCDSAATEGGDGSNGGDGLEGSSGARGAQANDFDFKIIGKLNSPIHLLTQGGQGGKGGVGGNGGNGGCGGRGGSGSKHCGCGRGGQGGAAGKGGKGGRGGQGGQGGNIFITYPFLDKSKYRPEAKALGGVGGQGGEPGKPGRAGAGGKNGDGTDSGRNGTVHDPGSANDPGDPGRPGAVFLNGQRIA